MKAEILFDTFRVARDTYKNGYDVARKKYEMEIEKAKQDFKSARLSIELSNAKEKFDSYISNLQDSVMNDVNDVIAKAKAAAKSRVTDKTIDPALLHMLRIPLSKTEFEIIAEKYAGSHYLNDKMLIMIAERNNINPDVKILPPVDDQLLALKDIEKGFSEMFASYDGDSYKSFDILSDGKILKCENRFYGKVDIKLPPEKRADRAYTAIMSSTDELSKGNALRNAIKSFGIDSKESNCLLSKVAKENKLSDVAMHYAGEFVMNAVREYKEGKRPDPVALELQKEDTAKEQAFKETGKVLSAMAAQTN